MTVWARRRLRSLRDPRAQRQVAVEAGCSRPRMPRRGRRRARGPARGRPGPRGGARHHPPRRGSVSTATTVPIRACAVAVAGQAARGRGHQRAEQGLARGVGGADHGDVDRGTPRANGHPGGNSPAPPRGCLGKAHPLRTQEPSWPTNPPPPTRATSPRAPACRPSSRRCSAGLTGGPVDPQMAQACADMGIDKVDPAMVQMMVGQVQAMMASTDDSPFNVELATDTARKVVAASGDASVGEAAVRAMDAAAQVAELWLDEVTAFEAPGVTTHAWSRAEWVEATMPTWQALVEPVAEGVGSAVASAMRAQIQQLGDGALPEGMLPPGMDASAMLGQMEPMITRMSGSMFGLQVGQALGTLATETVSRHRGRASRSRPTARSPCSPPTSRPSPTASEVDLDQVRLYLAVREAARVRLFAEVPVDRAAAAHRGPGLRPRHQHRHRPHRVGAAVRRPERRLGAAVGAAGPAVPARPEPGPAAPRSSGWRPTSPSSRAGSTSSPTGRPATTCRRRPPSARRSAAVARRAGRPRRRSPRSSASSCARAGCATPPTSGPPWRTGTAPQGRDAALGPPRRRPHRGRPRRPARLRRAGRRRASDADLDAALDELLGDGRRAARACSGLPADPRRGRAVTAAPPEVPAAYLALREDALRVLEQWQRPRRRAGAAAGRAAAHARAHPGALWKQGPPAHLTTSALVLDASLDKVLLTLHAKAGMWLQFGGHVEPGRRRRSSTRPPARRARSPASPGWSCTRELVHLDRHTLLAAGFGRCAEHLDLRWAGVVEDEDGLCRERGVARRGLVAGGRAPRAQPATRSCPWRWRPGACWAEPPTRPSVSRWDRSRAPPGPPAAAPPDPGPVLPARPRRHPRRGRARPSPRRPRGSRGRARAAGSRQQRPELRAVARREQVGQLVEDDVVEDVARHALDPGRDADRAVGRRARPPAGLWLADPADARRAGQAAEVALRQVGGTAAAAARRWAAAAGRPWPAARPSCRPSCCSSALVKRAGMSTMVRPSSR